MSGTDNTSPTYRDPPMDCASIDFTAQVSSPKSTVVAKMNAGDVLDVEAKAYQERTVLILTTKGEIAGGLASPQAAKILECINDGHRYVADVQLISGGQVRVRVHHS